MTDDHGAKAHETDCVGTVVALFQNWESQKALPQIKPSLNLIELLEPPLEIFPLLFYT